MKRIVLPIIILAAVACTREEPEALINFKQELTIKAYAGDSETRTERSSYGAVLWSPGDEISVFYGSGTDGGSRFTAQNTETSKVVNFTGSMNVVTGGNDVSPEDTYFLAVYPYNASASCDGSSVTTVLPSQQLATPGTFADDLFPTLGYSKGLNMPFYNICGGLKFTLSEEGIKSVTIKGNNGEILAGTITVGLDDSGMPDVKRISNGSETITVSAPEGECFEVGKSYYIIMVPTEFESGFTLTFSKGDTQAVMYRLIKTNIRRSVFGTLSSPDANLVWGDIDYVVIPDDNFRDYMIQHFDTNGNGVLDFDEAAAVTEINDLNTDNIYSLIGVEYLTNLERLRCVGSNTTVINVFDEERNIYIKKCFGGTGQLTSLDLSHNPSLTYLNCNYNKLTSIKLSNNALLDRLYCGYNLLEELDLSNNSALTYLYCSGDQILKTLDLSNNLELSEMSFMYNDIESLDLSGHTKLNKITISEGSVVNLDLSGCSSLDYVQCRTNKLKKLNLNDDEALTRLYCWQNQLISLDVSRCTALRVLDCSSNQLSELIIGAAGSTLEEIYCSSNKLVSLDISNCTSLTKLNCSSNQLSVLTMGAVGSALAEIICATNKLVSLDIGNCTSLTNLICSDNLLTSLDVSSNPELSLLNCSSNLLTTLDVSALSTLNILNCTSNPNLSTVWLSIAQTLNLEYDPEVTSIKYVGYDYDSPLATEINSADDLIEWLIKADNNATGEYRIVASELDMAGKTVHSASSFPGTFDGNGCVIKNLVCGKPLFESLSGTVKNLVFDSSCCFEPDVLNFGIIAGVNNGSITGIVNNAQVSYGVSSSLGAPQDAVCFGAIAAKNYGTMESCANNGTVSLRYDSLPSLSCIWGGVVGYTSGLIKNCNNTGSVSVSVDNPASGTYHSFGGVVGLYEGAAGRIMVDDCRNTGDVSLEFGTPSFFGVGGVVGTSPSAKQTPGNYGIVSNCTNEGNMSMHYINGGSGAYPNIGGVIGYTEGQLKGCINRGAISLLCDSNTLTWTCVRLAGVGGTVTQGAEDCHNYGSLSVSALIAGGTAGYRYSGNTAACCFGGVVAAAGPYNSDGTVIFKNCSNNCDLNLSIRSLTETPNLYFGGLFGYVTGRIDNCQNNGSFTVTSPVAINRLGGIAGGCNYDVSNCSNTGALCINHCGITKADWRSFVGGIIADASKSDTVVTYTNCSNSGNLNFNSTSYISTAKTSAVGGIVGCGKIGIDISFTNCTNTGIMTYNSSGVCVTGELRGGDYN